MADQDTHVPPLDGQMGGFEGTSPEDVGVAVSLRACSTQPSSSPTAVPTQVGGSGEGGPTGL